MHVCAFQICSACMCEKLRIEHSPNDEATKKSERMRIEKENEGIKEDFDISAPLIGCIYFARCRLIYFSKPEISYNCKRKESRTPIYAYIQSDRTQREGNELPNKFFCMCPRSMWNESYDLMDSLIHLLSCSWSIHKGKKNYRQIEQFAKGFVLIWNNLLIVRVEHAALKASLWPILPCEWYSAKLRRSHEDRSDKVESLFTPLSHAHEFLSVKPFAGPSSKFLFHQHNINRTRERESSG